VVVLEVRSEGPAGWRSEAAFWSLLTLLCILLVAGALPWFWLIPFADKVQFPWRLMIVVEFAVVTAFCLAPWTALQQPMRRLLRWSLRVLAPALALLLVGVVYHAVASIAEPESPADVKQFLPAGFPMKAEYDELGLEPLQGVPTIACTPTARTCRAAALPLGELAIEIESDAPTNVVVRRFAYPFWQIEPALPLSATVPLRLVSFTAPDGRHSYRLQHVRPAAEKAGWAVSGVALLVFLAVAAAVRYRRKLLIR